MVVRRGVSSAEQPDAVQIAAVEEPGRGSLDNGRVLIRQQAPDGDLDLVIDMVCQLGRGGGAIGPRRAERRRASLVPNHSPIMAHRRPGSAAPPGWHGWIA